MGKNILLTEGQFKQYVKGVLLNEDDFDFLDDFPEEMSTEEVAAKKKEISAKIRTWMKGTRKGWDTVYPKIAPVDLYLDKVRVAPGEFKSPFKNPADANIPMDIDEFMKKTNCPQYSENYLINSAQEYALGRCNKTYEENREKGDTRFNRDPTAKTIKDFNRDNLSKEEKIAYDAKQAAIERAEKFKDDLSKVISDPTSPAYGNVPHNGINPEDIKNESTFISIVKTCKKRGILYTSSGDIYVPIMPNWDEVRDVQRAQPNENVRKMKDSVFLKMFGKKFPVYVMQNLLQEADMGTKVSLELYEKYVRFGFLMGPFYKFVGLGGKDNMSAYFYFSYISDKEREENRKNGAKPIKFDNAGTM